MKIPHLMPFQMEPFNGDHFIEAKFIELQNRFKIEISVETGTCLGSTTLFLSKAFDRVHSIELNQDYQKIAQSRLEETGTENVELVLGDSAVMLESIRPTKPVIYFLDAHWGNHCPLLTELFVIGKTSLFLPVIAIHDFFVPNEPELGFDSIKGQPFTIGWIEPHLEKIYGHDGFDFEYNTFEKSAGARRGIIYITPRNA